MMHDFIHMGQEVGHKYRSAGSCARPPWFLFEKFSAASPRRSLWFLARLTSAFFAHRFTTELDPVGVVHQTIKDAVGDCRIADLLVPVRHRHLGREDNRPALVSVIADLEEIAALAVLEWRHGKIVQHQNVDARELEQEPAEAAIGVCDSQFPAQLRRSLMQYRETVTACLLRQRACQPTTQRGRGVPPSYWPRPVEQTLRIGAG